MKGLIHCCTGCGGYTLKEQCPHCGRKAGDPRPPRYSPEDRYGRYRRMMRQAVKGT